MFCDAFCHIPCRGSRKTSGGSDFLLIKSPSYGHFILPANPLFEGTFFVGTRVLSSFQIFQPFESLGSWPNLKNSCYFKSFVNGGIDGGGWTGSRMT